MREPSGAKTIRDPIQEGEKILEKLHQASEAIELAIKSRIEFESLDNPKSFFDIDESLKKDPDFSKIQNLIQLSKDPSQQLFQEQLKKEKIYISNLDQLIKIKKTESNLNQEMIKILSSDVDDSLYELFEIESSSQGATVRDQFTSDNQGAKVRESVSQLESRGAEGASPSSFEKDKQKLMEQIQLFITTLTHNNPRSEKLNPSILLSSAVSECNTELKFRKIEQEIKPHISEFLKELEIKNLEKEIEKKTRRLEKEKAKKEAEGEAKKEAEKKSKREAEAKARKEAEKKSKREAEAKARKEAEEKTKLEAEAKSKREAEEKAKKEAEAIAKKEEKERRRQEFLEEEKLRQEHKEKTRIEEEKLQKELAENAKRQAEAQVKQQEIEKQIKQQQVEEIKDRILAKTSANFEKFQPLFNYLREVKWLEIKEIGLFGSRVYREVISETCPSIEIPNNPKADFDIYCISGGPSSSGVYRLFTDLGARDSFQEIINKFNATNPNLQISFLEEKDGKKSVNMSEKNQSSNFKLVATFLEDKVGEEKTEKIVKEKIEFDLNFYKQQSMLENLQWQFNLERVLLTQNPDRTFALKINHCNCDPSQEKMTVEDFFAKAQGEEMREFLFESNPKAQGFLNRMINKKGIYKYLDEDTLNALKSGLLEDEYIKENLKKELSDYKKIVDDKASKSPESEMVDEKFKQAKFILDTIEKDEIFKENKDFQEILRTIPRVTPAGANVAQSSSINR